MRRYVLIPTALFLFACQTPVAKPEVPVTPEVPKPAEVTAKAEAMTLDAILAARPEEERARDKYRHPKETLAFFGVTPSSSVLELWSGRGWYTHVLAPYLAPAGKLHITVYAEDAKPAYRAEMRQGLLAWLEKSGLSKSIPAITINTEAVDFGLDAQVDFVLTFRNVHNWVKGGYDRAVYEQAFRALKPGGVFGVVEHRGPEGMTREQSATSGYMDQKQVIADIEAVGFTFVGASEVNANAKDTKDHPKGVWTLPPSLRLKEVDQEKYQAIGESDRMTLKFMKPKS